MTKKAYDPAEEGIAGSRADARAAAELAEEREISLRIWRAGQSLRFERIVAVGDHRFRVSIKRDAYDSQSYGRVEVFDGSKWNEATTVWGNRFLGAVAEHSYAAPANRERVGTAARGALTRLGADLLREARLITGV